MTKTQIKMIEAIQKHGALLVYPIKNKKDPKSLWSSLYPKSPMVWDWNEDADNRISRLWIDREAVSRSEEVVYTKWYQGRATFFSKEVFVCLLAYFKSYEIENQLSQNSKQALSELKSESPLSTKKIKALLDWQGRLMESHYTKSMKPLWDLLYIVGFGEENDSSFPSLNMAATSTLFEAEWLEAKSITALQAQKRLLQLLGEDSLFFQHAVKLGKKYKLLP